MLMTHEHRPAAALLLLLMKSGVNSGLAKRGLMALRQFSWMFSLSYFIRLLKNSSTFDMTVDFAAFQLRAFGILPFGAIRIITPDRTITTAGGGVPKAFNSVKLPLFKVSRAS